MLSNKLILAICLPIALFFIDMAAARGPASSAGKAPVITHFELGEPS